MQATAATMGVAPGEAALQRRPEGGRGGVDTRAAGLCTDT